MPLYGGAGTTEEITAWARLVVQAVRAAGATQPISLGDGAWGIEVDRQRQRLLAARARAARRLRRAARLPDGGRRGAAAADGARSCASSRAASGKPVVLEEFGVSSDFAVGRRTPPTTTGRSCTRRCSPAHSGWIAWNNCDYDDLRDQDPYRHHVFELHFGLTDRTGGRSRSSASWPVRRGSSPTWRRTAGSRSRARRRCVVPEHFERELPFTTPELPAGHPRGLLQAYVAAREADLPVELARERDGIPGDARLVPRAVGQAADHRRASTACASSRTVGATVYLSFFAGSTPSQRGPWLPGLDELFGVEHRLRYGLVDPIEDEVVFEFVEPLGDLDAGTRLRVRVAGAASAAPTCRSSPAGAEVVADRRPRPPGAAPARARSGSTVLCTYPLEHMAARTPRVNPESTWRLYSALACAAGVSRPIRVDDPRVLVGRVRSGPTERACFVNCSGDTVALEPILESGVELVEAAATIGPYEIIDRSARAARRPGGRRLRSPLTDRRTRSSKGGMRRD